MNRREFLQCAAVLAAGTAVPPAGWALSPEQRAFLADRRNYLDRHPLTLFSAPERAAVAAVADQIIPATDTPGAIDAGTPRFIELMVADWLNEAERALFMEGLADLQARAGGDFAGVPRDEQLELLERLEDEAGDSTWYQLGNVTRVWDETAPFICQIKELTVLGFLLSEVGGTRFLRVNPMGPFDGDVPLGPEDASYVPEMPIRSVAMEIQR